MSDASSKIDERIEKLDDWRGETLSRLRALIKQADPGVVEEWKWDVPTAFKALLRAAVALNKSSRK